MASARSCASAAFAQLALQKRFSADSSAAEQLQF
jgi:hypothetical protein